MEWFKGKKTVITGGSGGIGKAAAILLAQAGGHVCICARDRARLDEALKEIRSHAVSSDQKITGVTLDVSDRGRVKAAVTDIVNQLGGIDILINCAGITHPGYIQDIADQVWDSMMQVDYMGTVNAVRAFLPYFIAQKHGSIANVSSVCGYMGVFGYGAYTPAKFAVVGFSECIRQELLPYNVGISVLYPPDTDTPQLHEENKIKPQETRVLSGNIKVMPPSKVAQALLRGIGKRRFTIVPGTMNKLTYFLNRHFPWLIWMIVSGDLRKYWKKNKAHS